MEDGYIAWPSPSFAGGVFLCPMPTVPLHFPVSCATLNPARV